MVFWHALTGGGGAADVMTRVAPCEQISCLLPWPQNLLIVQTAIAGPFWRQIALLGRGP